MTSSIAHFGFSPKARAAGAAPTGRTLQRPGNSSTDFPGPRCREKGCVFPAGLGMAGRCLHHDRQLHEPVLFNSRQPTQLLLDRAKFGLPNSEPDDSRAADRRRQTQQRELFLLEEAA